jgi:hypothetical protein
VGADDPVAAGRRKHEAGQPDQREAEGALGDRPRLGAGPDCRLWLLIDSDVVK